MTWGLLTPFSGRSLAQGGADPFSALQRELNRVFDEAYSGRAGAASMPAAANVLKLDVKEDDKAFHVTADMPGMEEKDVEVTFDDGLLTIRGERRFERDEKKDTWHVVERSWGSFARQLSLPANVNAEAIEAKFDKGVLTVLLPKQPEAQSKAKKIEVKGK